MKFSMEGFLGNGEWANAVGIGSSFSVPVRAANLMVSTASSSSTINHVIFGDPDGEGCDGRGICQTSSKAFGNAIPVKMTTDRNGNYTLDFSLSALRAKQPHQVNNYSHAAKGDRVTVTATHNDILKAQRKTIK